MTQALAQEVARLAGAQHATRGERIQALWDGYGEAVRWMLTGAEVPSVVVKHVQAGSGKGRSHERKLRSYEVERVWYQDWSSRCRETCRVARCFSAHREGTRWLFVFEDLDAAGFDRRHRNPSGVRLDACLRWLASLHATFMGARPRGLWKTGTYWHLATRPDELAAMPKGPLRDGAAAIDARLRAARFKTIVHGDAKPSNFCFRRDGGEVAAVDFQYVGGGSGVKDVAYLLTGEGAGTVKRGLEVYFQALRKDLAAKDVDADAVEEEGRALYPFAVADFQRFMTGWSPGWRASAYERETTRRVLEGLRSTI